MPLSVQIRSNMTSTGCGPKVPMMTSVRPCMCGLRPWSPLHAAAACCVVCTLSRIGPSLRWATSPGLDSIRPPSPAMWLVRVASGS